jgi:hypothetical protein
VYKTNRCCWLCMLWYWSVTTRNNFVVGGWNLCGWDLQTSIAQPRHEKGVAPSASQQVGFITLLDKHFTRVGGFSHFALQKRHTCRRLLLTRRANTMESAEATSAFGCFKRPDGQKARELGSTIRYSTSHETTRNPTKLHEISRNNRFRGA